MAKTEILSLLGWIIINLIGITLRIRRINSQVWKERKNVVFGFWHGEQFILCYCHKNQGVVIMSSLSKDGEMQAGILKRFGYNVVRGSSSRGGERALVEMIRLIRKGFSCAFAVDGPRGPYHEIKPGVAYLPMKSNTMYIPAISASKHRIVFTKAWDKYEMPVPFSPAVVCYGKPIEVKEDKALAGYLAEMKNSMEELTAFTHKYYWSKEPREYLEHHPNPKILMIQPSRMGDVVFSLPTLSVLRKKYPKAWIGWFVDERCAPLLEGNPDLDEIIVFDRSNVSYTYLRSLKESLRKKEIDVSLDLHGLFKSAFMAWLAGAHFKLASSSTNGMRELSWLISREIKAPSQNMHCIERHLEVAAYLGCDTGKIDYKFNVDEEKSTKVDEILKALKIDRAKPLILIHPGGGWVARRWFPERYSELINRLVLELKAEVILIGGKEGGSKEKGLNEKIRSSSKSDVKDLTDKLDLKELMALYKKSSLFIGNEAGPMHIAVALGLPTVAIIGPTDPGRTGPYKGDTIIVTKKVDCQPCRERNCRTKVCMERISVQDVFEAAKIQLGIKD
ncbi:MAG: DUF374 domain-containing protein [Elusimicrobia bacterium]|nr:DUF374 domain-containing protein [Candidatus Liberimonas magnetica]